MLNESSNVDIDGEHAPFCEKREPDTEGATAVSRPALCFANLIKITREFREIAL